MNSINSVLTTRTNQHVPVLEIHDRFDAHIAPAVASWLERATAGESRHLIIDMRDVPFIDSAGLAVLMRGMKACRARGGDLALCGVQQSVLIIFEVTKMRRVFSLYEDETAAIAAIQG